MTPPCHNMDDCLAKLTWKLGKNEYLHPKNSIQLRISHYTILIAVRKKTDQCNLRRAKY